MDNLVGKLSSLFTSLLGSRVMSSGKPDASQGGLLNNFGNIIGDYVSRNSGNASAQYSTGSTPTPTNRKLLSPVPKEEPKSYGVKMKQPDAPPIYDFGENDKPPVPEVMRKYIDNVSQMTGIDPSVLSSILAQEIGGFNYKARRGADGEEGVTQIIPRFHYKKSSSGDTSTPEEYGKKLSENDYFAIFETARILKELLGGGDDYSTAIGEYNAGPGNTNPTYVNEVLGRIGR